MAEARSSILARLRAAGDDGVLPEGDTAVMARRAWSPAERVALLRKGMEAVHTEFLEATSGDWPEVVSDFCRREGLVNLLYGPGSDDGQALAAAWAAGGPELVPYSEQVEAFKDTLFHRIEAGFTSTIGGVAETGGLLLEPGPDEPRLLSLVPPMHIALLRASTIQDSLWSAIRDLGWGKGPGANSLLISGPSKTADIEQTLAYGVHGPKRLIVILVDDLNGPVL